MFRLTHRETFSRSWSLANEMPKPSATCEGVNDSRGGWLALSAYSSAQVTLTAREVVGVRGGAVVGVRVTAEP